MPHAVVVSKVSLQPKGPIEQVRGSGDDIEVRSKVGLESVIILSRSSRIELFKLAYWTHEQRTSQLLQLESNPRIVDPCGGAFVEYPSPYRHISSELSTLRSTRSLSR